MSNDPYPNERPDPHATDPYAADPYSSDPYIPSTESTHQLPAHEPGRPAPLPPTTGMAPPPGVGPQAGLPYAPGQLPGPGMPPPYPYAPPAPVNTSAIVLIVLSSLTIFTGYCCYIGIPGLVLGILGVTKNSTDPEGAAKLTKIGWITFAALTAVTLIGIAIFVVALIASEA